MPQLETGDIAWAELGPSRGREQSGRSPVLVVSSPGYLESIDTLVIVVPVTTRDRGWPNHIPLSGPTGLGHASWAMTEQPVTIARERVFDVAGNVDAVCLASVRVYLIDFLGL